MKSVYGNIFFLILILFLMNTHVIKVGGENASDIRTAGWLAESHANGEKIAVAISALRTKPLNTTNELLKAQKAYTTGGIELASPILENLFAVHLDTLREIGVYTSELADQVRKLYDEYFPRNLSFPADLLRQHPDIAKEQRFMGYGEVMSAHVLRYILRMQMQVKSILIQHKVDIKPDDTRNLSRILRDEVGTRVHS